MGLPEGLRRQLHHELGIGARDAQTGDCRGGRLCAGRRMRAGDDVRSDHRGRYGEVRPAGNNHRDDAWHGRDAEAAACCGQGQGDGLVPDRPHDRCAGSRALGIGGPRRPGRQTARRSAGGRRQNRRLFAAGGHENQGSDQSRVRIIAVRGPAYPSAANSMRPSRWTIRRKACARSSKNGSPTSNTARRRVRHPASPRGARLSACRRAPAARRMRQAHRARRPIPPTTPYLCRSHG